MSEPAQRGLLNGALSRVISSRPGTWLFLRVATRVDRPLLRWSRGRFSLTATSGQPALLLETVGARSGEPRETPLLYVPDGERVILIASNGGNPRHPAWYHNLRARPETTALIGGRRVRYAVREAEGEEREALWKKAASVYSGYEVYEERVGERRIPVMLLEPIAEVSGGSRG